MCIVVYKVSKLLHCFTVSMPGPVPWWPFKAGKCSSILKRLERSSLFDKLCCERARRFFRCDGRSLAVIVEAVKKGPMGKELFRPPVETLQCQDYVLHVMHDCWAEKPDSRPELSQVQERLKKMRQGM